LVENIADFLSYLESQLGSGKNLMIETFHAVGFIPDPACDTDLEN
jgi:hypothetical protein